MFTAAHASSAWSLGLVRTPRCGAPAGGQQRVTAPGLKSRSLGAWRIPGPALPRPLLSPSSLLPFRGFPFLPSDPGLEEIDPQTI